MGDEWNSLSLEISYEVFGWLAFFSWSFSFYPQIVVNFQRQSVVGLSFDYALLSLTKHSTYLLYNTILYFSPAVQQQYREKYGLDQMIPVAANDVAFSTHAVALAAYTLLQTYIYERGNQTFSKTAIAFVSAAWFTVVVAVIIALPNHSWILMISVFNIIQVLMSVVKYTPQVIMNFLRKNTDGFSIGAILLDLVGGWACYGQMAMQSIDQGSWVNFYGNIGKTLLSLVTILYDLLFMVQHYVLYRDKKTIPPLHLDEDNNEKLLENSTQTLISHV